MRSSCSQFFGRPGSGPEERFRNARLSIGVNECRFFSRVTGTRGIILETLLLECSRVDGIIIDKLKLTRKTADAQ